jgi:predicted nucleic acid-binding protein
LRFYFDTSALVPAYAPESRSEKAAFYLASAETVYLSRLTEVEFYSALALKFRTRQMRRKDADRIAKVFARHLASDAYVRLQLPGEVFDSASAYLTASPPACAPWTPCTWPVASITASFS